MKRKIKLNKSNVIVFMFLIFILIGCGKTKEENRQDKTLNNILEKEDKEKISYIEFNEKVFLKGKEETPNKYSINYYPSGRVKNIVYNSNLYEVEDKSLLSLIKGLQNDINALIEKDLEYATQTYEVIPAYIIAEKLNKNIDENDRKVLENLENISENTINKLYEKLKIENPQTSKKIQEKIQDQTKILEKLNTEEIIVKDKLTLRDEVEENKTQDITSDNSNDLNTTKESSKTTSNNIEIKSKLDSTIEKKKKEKIQEKKVKCDIYYDGVERDQMILKNGQKIFVNSDGCIN